jgi:hypothetical protein
MLEKRTHRLAALVLVLLMVLTTVAMAAGVPTSSGATPDRINWGKLGAYLECAVCVYMAVDSGGATAVLAVAVCGRAWSDFPN